MSKQKYAVVTGATKGIGCAISKSLLKKGYFVIGNYDSDDAAARKMLVSVGRYSDKLTLIKKDLSSYEAACDLALLIKDISPSIDILICNCGVTDPTEFPMITPDGWNRVMNVNLNAPFFLIQQLATTLSKGNGRILMIGSIMGEYPHARSISYGVSKAAVHMLVQYLIKYFSPHGITVNGIMPGFVDTAWKLSKTPEHRKRIEDKIALHRFAKPEEIADFCMAVINNSYVNGSVLNIDGGYDFK